MVEVIDELRRKSTMVGSLERKFVLDGISTPDEALGFAIFYTGYRLEQVIAFLCAVGKRVGWERKENEVLVNHFRGVRQELDQVLSWAREGDNTGVIDQMISRAEYFSESGREDVGKRFAEIAVLIPQKLA